MFFLWSLHSLKPSPPILVAQTETGAASERSPPSCVSTKNDASQRTAAGTATVWMDAVAVTMAGRGLPVTLWCVSHQRVDNMASALPVSMKVQVKMKQNCRIAYSRLIMHL